MILKSKMMNHMECVKFLDENKYLSPDTKRE